MMVALQTGIDGGAEPYYNCPYCRNKLTVMSGKGGIVAICENESKCNGLEVPRQNLENYDEYNWYVNERKSAETFEAQPNFNEETQEYDGTIKEIYKDPKTNELRVKGRWYYPQRGEWVEYDTRGCQYEGCAQMYSPEWDSDDYCTSACVNDMTICGKNKPYSYTSYGSTRLIDGWEDGAYGDFCQSLTEDVVYDRDGEEQEKRIMCNDCDYEKAEYGAETFEAFKNNPQFKERNYYGAEGKKNCGCGKDPCITYGAETTMTVEHEDGSKYRYSETDPIYGEMGEIVGHVSEITDEKDTPYQKIYDAEMEDDMTAIQVSIGCPSGSTKDFTKIFDVNARGSDLEYLTSELEDEIKGRVASWNKTYDAEMEELTDGVASITNRFGDGVGIIQVDDEDLEDVSVEITDGGGDVVYEGILGDEDAPDMEEDDYYFSETVKESPIKKNTGWVALASLALGTLAFLNRDVIEKKIFNNETQEMLENDPELIETPNIGNLDPAQYEELVVQSTGYAVDVIPVSLDGSFMGSRFAALPTDRYVEYNDPGIGAHTDIAMNRDEVYLEPEMAVVQASENVVKESQAPGQSPYNSVNGQENLDFDYRVIKETHPVSLDPAVKPFIPESMTGYTGNANTPPSVMNKMFNIGVLGQTPLFVPKGGDIGASRTGSRNATPNTLGLDGSVGGPLSDQVNANYTDGQTSKSLAQWAIENTVSQTSDTEAVVIDRSSGQMKRVRRV